MIDVVITKRRDDLHAQVKDHPELWASGQNYYEVIGNLVMTHSDVFGGIRVEYEGGIYGSH
jgi:hypothetical protein